MYLTDTGKILVVVVFQLFMSHLCFNAWLKQINHILHCYLNFVFMLNKSYLFLFVCECVHA